MQFNFCKTFSFFLYVLVDVYANIYRDIFEANMQLVAVYVNIYCNIFEANVYS